MDNQIQQINEVIMNDGIEYIHMYILINNQKMV